MNQLYEVYEAIEEAVREKKQVKIPEGILLKTGYAPTGTTFTISELYWVDEERNIYEAWMQIEYRKSDMLPGLYVSGSRTLDGLSSGITSVFRKENRYPYKESFAYGRLQGKPYGLIGNGDSDD